MFLDKLKDKRILLIGSISAILLIFSVFYVMLLPKNKTDFEVTSTSQLEALSSTSVLEEKSFDELFYVDIKGAVRTPGVYEVDPTMRVLDVVKLAGGFTEQSDDKKVNLAQRLVDQMVIYIPEFGEEEVELMTQAYNGEVSSQGKDAEVVNLNTATIAELQSLSGVGEKKAEKIIQYREENGSFKSIEELKKVDGIGQKTFDSLKSQITI